MPVRAPSPPLAPGETVVETFPTDARQWRGGGYLGIGADALTVPAGILVWVVLGSFGGFLLMLVILAIGGIFFLPAIAGMRLATAQPLLTTTRLLQPAFLRGWDAIDLAAVVGIGLRYQCQHTNYYGNGSPAGIPGRWELLVWPTDGTERSLPVASPVGREDSAWTTRDEPQDAAGWQHEWDLLAACPMGRAAIRIAEQVRAVQGPGGPYEKAHLELTAGVSSQHVTAYWTPAHRLGSLT